MRIFISGTDTDVGKTVVCSWLCLHSGYDYFKPVQTGSEAGTDSLTVANLSPATTIHRENYVYPGAFSPHLSAFLQGETIALEKIQAPSADRLIIEGAGGVLVPVNRDHLMIDLIAKLKAPVILVARSTLGTINHTLLSLEALRQRNIPVLGVIVNGPLNQANNEAIAHYGRVSLLGVLPGLSSVTQETLKSVPLSESLKQLME